MCTVSTQSDRTVASNLELISFTTGYGKHTTTPSTLIAPLLILKLRDSTVWKLPYTYHLHIRLFTAIQFTQRKQVKNH